MKKFLIGAAIFLVFMGIGGIYRLFWFRSHQIGIFERKFAYKELADSKLGGKTPQETWNLYLDALEKGDVDLAVQYWVPEAREDIKQISYKRKNANLLTEYARNHSRHLIEVKKQDQFLQKGEKLYSYRYIKEKKIEFIGVDDKITEDFLKAYWIEQKTDRVETQERITLQLNSYTHKWLIKE